MKKIVLIGLGVLLLVAFLTNPDQVKHKDVVKQWLLEEMRKESAAKTEVDPMEQAAQVFAMAFVNGIIDSMISSDNYILFSTTKVNGNVGESKVIGFGVFGHVFLGDLKEMKNKELGK